MDKLINNRKMQLLEMQKMLRMQDLLQEYDRQNLFLNKQVNSLLKQNLVLKQQKSLLSSRSSLQMTSDNYASRSNSKGNITGYYDQSISYSYQKSKSRYQYMYDEGDIRNLKTNLKKQIKRVTIQNSASKQIQPNIEEASIRLPSKINFNDASRRNSSANHSSNKGQSEKITNFNHARTHQSPNNSNSKGQRQEIINFNQARKHLSPNNINGQGQREGMEDQVRFQINRPKQIKKFSGENFTPIKRHQQQTYLDLGQKSNPKNSKSKSKSKSKQKLQVSLKARPSMQLKPFLSTSAKTHSPNRQGQKPLQQKQQEFTMKEIQQGAELFLQHSFGNKSAQGLQKKFTIMEMDLNLEQSKHEPPLAEISDSRISQKFLPLSIESKQLDINIQGKRLGVTIESKPLGTQTSKQTAVEPSRQIPRDPSKQLPYDFSNQLYKDISIQLPKTQLQKPGLSVYSEPPVRSESKKKRNHSLNPSPKVQYNPNLISTHKVEPFIIHTQEPVPGPSAPPLELHRNPSDKIKRKFIKIVSIQKIPAHQLSPKK